MPDNALDMAAAKLAIDQLIDPSTDVAGAQAKLDEMVGGIRTMLPPSATELQKVAAIRTYLHSPGIWNQHRPYRYDMRDPLGQQIENKLLATYLETRRGNCVSMPILFMLLGRRLGLEMTLARVPSHIVVKFRHPAEGWITIEATSGGYFARDSHVAHETNATKLGLRTGFYLRPLSRREASVLMLETLVQHHYQNRGWIEAQMDAAILVLELVPTSYEAMMWLSRATNRMIMRDCKRYGPTMASAPRQMYTHCLRLARLDNQLWEKAVALGHRKSAPE